MPNDGRKGATGPGKGAFTQPGSPQLKAPPAMPPVGLPAAAAPQAPAPSYAELYQQALSHANYGVGQQFGLALGDIANREGQANKAMGGLPAAYQTAFGTAQNVMNQNTQAATQAMDNAHMQQFVAPAAYMAPLQAALAQNQAAYQSDIPTLQGALSAEFGRQRSEVEQQRAAAEMEARQRAEAQAHDEANMMLQHQWDVQGRREDRRFTARQNKAQRGMDQEDYAGKLALQHSYDMETMRAQQDAEVLDPLTGLTGGQHRKATQSEAYKHFTNKIRAGKNYQSTNFLHGIGSLGRDFTDSKHREYKPEEIDDMIDASGLPVAVKNALRYDMLAHATTSGGKSLLPSG